jgi:ubiquinone biosynthesis protein COQ9
MTAPERSEERDAALAALLPLVPSLGWTTRALRAALERIGHDPAQAGWLFQGPADMIEAYIDLSDRRMEAAAADLPDRRLTARVRAIVALRLHQARTDREAVRRAAGVLALPANAVLAARTLARTVDTIWHAAGDQSADFSWYTKRAILAGVYGATLLFWLRQDEWSDPEDEATLAFLDRRLAMVGRIGKLRGRLPLGRFGIPRKKGRDAAAQAGG